MFSPFLIPPLPPQNLLIDITDSTICGFFSILLLLREIHLSVQNLVRPNQLFSDAVDVRQVINLLEVFGFVLSYDRILTLLSSFSLNTYAMMCFFNVGTSLYKKVVYA